MQNLLRLIKANESAKDFDLSEWTQPCGTFGCLVGNDLIANKDKLTGHIKCNMKFCTEYYGLTENEADFLFSPNNYRRIFSKQLKNNMIQVYLRDPYDKEAAINRVRKFVYWKLRKKEIMASDDARHIEGDWNLAEQCLLELV